MNRPTRTEPAAEIVRAYLELGDALRMSALPSWIATDLNLSQLKALVLLEYHGAKTVSGLARLLEVGNPAASTLVQQLVLRGLAERAEDARDRRRTLVRPTAKGAGLIAGRREHNRANLLRWLSQLDEEELAGLRRGLVALVRAVREEEATAGDGAAARMPS